MSLLVTSWVWQHSRAEGLDRFVLLAIADCADDTGRAWPGVDYLAHEMCRLSRSTVYKILRRLIDEGHLVVEQDGGGRGRRTIYRVVMTTPKPSTQETVSGSNHPTEPSASETVSIPSRTQKPSVSETKPSVWEKKPSTLDALTSTNADNPKEPLRTIARARARARDGRDGRKIKTTPAPGGSAPFERQGPTYRICEHGRRAIECEESGPCHRPPASPPANLLALVGLRRPPPDTATSHAQPTPDHPDPTPRTAEEASA